MTSLQIREKGLAWMSEGDFPEVDEFFFYFRISSLLHDELQDDGVYLWCWVEGFLPDIADNLDILAGELHREREEAVMWFFSSSFEYFFSNFLLHHDGHFFWWCKSPL